MKLALALLSVATACASDGSTPQSTTPTSTATRARTEAPVSAVESRRPQPGLPAEATRLLAAHNQLVTAREDPEHTHLIHALRRLADALEVVAPARATEIIRVRQSAAELERTDVTAPIHADLTRAALEAAARALQEIRLPEYLDPMSIHALRLQEATDAVANAAAAIDMDVPLLDQYGYVRVALRESTRAVYAALLAEDPPVLVHTARR